MTTFESKRSISESRERIMVRGMMFVNLVLGEMLSVIIATRMETLDRNCNELINHLECQRKIKSLKKFLRELKKTI